MIGIFDSGIGGFTVAKEVLKKLPNCKIIYFGDTARLPYGTKGAEFIKKYSLKIAKWLLSQKAKSIIVACHTSSALASDFLREKIKGISIFDMISPTVREALKITKNKKIGVIGTPATIKSGIYEKEFAKLDKSLKVYSRACPLLVPLAEEGLVKGKIVNEVLKSYLKPLKEKGIDVLILGCTHYPLMKSYIEKIMGKKVIVVDPAKALVREIKTLKEKGSQRFFFSDFPYNLEKISRICFNKRIKYKVVNPF